MLFGLKVVFNFGLVVVFDVGFDFDWVEVVVVFGEYYDGVFVGLDYCFGGDQQCFVWMYVYEVYLYEYVGYQLVIGVCEFEVSFQCVCGWVYFGQDGLYFVFECVVGYCWILGVYFGVGVQQCGLVFWYFGVGLDF